MTGVYTITNLTNGKVYVGSAAVDFDQRFGEHLRGLRAGTHANAHLQAAWVKYGEQSFAFEVLVHCPPRACIVKEQLYLDLFDASNPDSGYNLRPTADSMLGYRASTETKARMSKRRAGSKLSAEHSKRISEGLQGHKLSEAARRKIGEANKRRVITPEARANMAAGQRNRKVEWGEWQ